MKAAVLTVSDRVAAGSAEDRSGPAARRALLGLGFDVIAMRVVPDGVESVEEALREWVAEGVPLVVTTGGTGFAPRDLTPEATRRVIERPAPGLAEVMRAASGPEFGMLSRAVCGIAAGTLIVNLPGSTGGVEDCLGAIGGGLRHALELVQGRDSDHNGAVHQPRLPE